MTETPRADAEVDALIYSQLDALPREGWGDIRLLSAELDARLLEGDGGEPWGIWHNRGPDGTITFPYVKYSPLAERAMNELGRHNLFVVFDWPEWFTRSVYRGHPELVDLASPADAVRLYIRLVRGERFSEGAFFRALKDGTVQTIFRRLLTHPAATI